LIHAPVWSVRMQNLWRALVRPPLTHAHSRVVRRLDAARTHPVDTSQIRIVWSRLADTSCAPPGTKRTADTTCSCPASVLTHFH
jgi:hypothetical protein